MCVCLYQVRDSAQSFLTVQVPLYVSYIYVTAPRGWASMEHHTQMEFSFFYDTVLWRTGVCVYTRDPHRERTPTGPAGPDTIVAARAVF